VRLAPIKRVRYFNLKLLEPWRWLYAAILDLNSNIPDRCSTHIVSIIE